VFIHGNYAARQEIGSSWWGCLCDVCFASKKSSERDFFVPAGTHMGVNSLTPIDGHDHQLFNEVHCSLVISTIFVHRKHSIARKLAVLFDFNRGI